MSLGELKLLEFSPERAADFRRINEEWITEMFTLEEKDRKVLSDPQHTIIDPGGVVLFVAAEGHGVVGAAALLKTRPDEYELTKMGVLKSARGLKAGEFLLKATIARSKQNGAKTLYLLTNRRCESAIHLYEKNGFVHDAEVMKRFGGEYQRCDVAMRYREQ
jgi:GNAT superfamily N-acetyltransferase